MGAELHVWTMTGTYATLGAAHAGLSFEYSGKQYYVTWFGSGDSKISAVRGHVDLGFNQIEKNGQLWERKRDSNGREFFFLPGTDTRLTRNVRDESDPSITKTEDFESFTVSLEGELYNYENNLNRPHYSIKIPVQNFFESGSAFTQGIDVHSIASWWEAKMALPPNHPGRQYKLISKSQNCIATVIEGLVVGGMGIYKKPGRAMFYYSETDLRTWAQSAIDKMNRINHLMSTSTAIQQIKNQAGLNTDLREIPTLKDWKKLSDRNVTLSVFARRKGPIKALDKLIELYHISNLEKIQKRALLIKIMNQAFAHMVTKPNSDRKQAVKLLAQISYNKVKDLTLQIDQEEMNRRLAELSQNVILRKTLEAIGEDDEMDVEYGDD